jgi:hypothetical protein
MAIFENYTPGLTAPASFLAPVTRNDTSDLPDGDCRALLVGQSGTANLIDASGAPHANVPLQQGYNPIRVRRVLTGGTAADIWAIY